MARIGLARDGRPNWGLEITASMASNVTRLSRFVAVSRASIVSRPRSGSNRDSAPSSDNAAGPRMELRPAVPHIPEGGVTYAAGLAYVPSTTGRGDSPVSVGRWPTNALPLFETNATGVNG